MRRALLALAPALLAACSTPDLGPAGACDPGALEGAPAVSAEIEIGGEPLAREGLRGLPPLQIAAGEGQYLAVWHDPAAVWFDPADPSGVRIVGTRVSAAGKVLDPFGVTLGEGLAPGVASDGAGFLVVWIDPQTRVLGARVAPDGSVLDPGGFVIAESYATAVTVAFDGASYLVAWEDTSGIRYVRITPGGEVLGPPVKIQAYVDTPQGWTGLACGGGTCLVGWRSGERIYGARIDPQGELLDAGFMIGPEDPLLAGSPSIAFDGQSFVAAWPTSIGVRASRVSPEGVVLDPAGIAVGSVDETRSVAVAVGGASTTIAWRGDEGGLSLRVARLSPEGEVLDATPAHLAEAVAEIAIAGSGGERFVIWAAYAPGDQYRILGTRLSPGGEARGAPGIPLHMEANPQELPALAFDGERFLAAWVDHRTDTPDDPIFSRGLYAARVTPEGAVLDPAGILLAEWDGGLVGPRAVFDGSSTLVLWWALPSECQLPACFECNVECVGELRAVRVSPEGDVLDPVPLELSVAGNTKAPPAAASNGAGTFVVSTRDGQVTGVWLDPSGEVLDVRSFGTGTDLESPGVASDGDGYLAVWSVNVGLETALFGVRISAAGAILDAGGIEIAAPSGRQRRPSVAFDGERYVVAWERSAPGGSGVFAARVSTAGEVLDPGGVLIAEGEPELLEHGGVGDPAVGFDGRRAVIAWRGRADQSDPSSVLDLFGATLGADGPPGPTFPISATPEREGPFALAGSGGELLAAYERFRPEAPFSAQRVIARRIDAGADGAACAEAPEPLAAVGGCRAAGSPPAAGGWLAPALGALLAAAARRAARPRKRRGDLLDAA